MNPVNRTLGAVRSRRLLSGRVSALLEPLKPGVP